jgi:hypothetical protein
MAGSRQMFYARLPDVKGTAGGVAFLLDEVQAGKPGLSLDAFGSQQYGPLLGIEVPARNK